MTSAGIDAFAVKMGEEDRTLFEGCSFEEQFADGIEPEQVAENEYDAPT